MKLARLALALATLCLPCAAQHRAAAAPLEPDPGASWSFSSGVLHSSARTDLRSLYSLSVLATPSAKAPLMDPGLGWAPGLGEELASALALTPPTSTPPPGAPGSWAAVHRRDLEGARLDALSFETLPGGIVFGLLAAPSQTFDEARLALEDGELRLHLDGRAFSLPALDPRELLACLSFVTREQPGEVLVDILRDGTVELAPEFQDTPAGALLIRADQVPFQRFPPRWRSKSVLVDRAARLELCDATGRAEPSAELEARYFEPGRPFLGLSPVEPVRVWVPARLEGDLAGAARIAGWIGFLRWARAADPEGFAALRAKLAATHLTSPAEPTPTARRVEPLPRLEARPEARVQPWMRAHRLREP